MPNLGGVAAASFSPEIILQATGDSTLNARMRSDLMMSAKAIYEHPISIKVGNDEPLTVREPPHHTSKEVVT
ncbi:MAG: hypothetical protein ACRDRW_04995 [Pseudonocardiaceae bacterium]